MITQDTRKWRFLVGDNSQWSQIESQDVIEMHKWTHLVLVYDSNSSKQHKGFINGKLEVEATFPGHVPTTSAAYRIGMHSDRKNYEFFGNMYDYRHFDRALSEDEISRIYNEGDIIGDEVLHLKFDKSPVSVVAPQLKGIHTIS